MSCWNHERFQHASLNLTPMRESGGSSTPRPIHVIADVPGTLGLPREPVFRLATGATRRRTTTVEVVTPSAPFVVLPDHLQQAQPGRAQRYPDLSSGFTQRRPHARLAKCIIESRVSLRSPWLRSQIHTHDDHSACKTAQSWDQLLRSRWRMTPSPIRANQGLHH